MSAILGPTVTRLVRATTFAVAVSGGVVFLANLAEPLVTGRSYSWPLGFATLAAVVTAVAVRRVDVRLAVHTGQGWWLIAVFPLAIACIAASLAPWYGQASVMSLGLLLAVHVAGLVSGRAIAVATLVVQMGAELWALGIARTPDLGWAATALVIGAAVHWTSRTSMSAIVHSFEREIDAMAEADRVAAARSDFVATVSHELRTPIHVVTGLAETLDEHWDRLSESDRQVMVLRLRRNGDHLRSLVDRLLHFSRLRSDTVELNRSLFTLAPIATEVVASAATAHPDHTVLVQVRDGGQVVGDPLLVERVVDNLVRNACHHTPPGTTVTVAASHKGHEVEVVVTDDGPGISAEDLPRLTERFFRGGDHLSRGSGGFGIGLAFCAEVLELHGRHLEVESEPGHGARFTFSLPVAEAPVQRVPGRVRSPSTVP